MNPNLTEYITACEWGVSKFLLISENVFDPLIYYSHLVPLIASVVLGAFVILKNPRNLSARVLLSILGFLAIWLIGDLILWATEFPSYTMFFWTVINVVEPFVYAFSLYFIYTYIDGRDISFTTKLAIFIPLIPTILFAPTHFTLLGFDLTNCDRDAIEGIAVYYGYIIELLYILSIIWFGVSRYLTGKPGSERRQIFTVTAGIVLFLLSFAFGNILGSFFSDLTLFGDYSWTIGQYGLFGVPVFLGVLSYLIVRYRAFNIGLFAAQALIGALVVILASEFAFVTSDLNRILVALTLILTVVIGFMLIRSVKREIEQREHIEKLAKDLKAANDRLTELDRLKSEFLSIASHQLRAPITAIRGYAANIAEGTYGAVPEYLREPMASMQETTRLMVNSIEDYLNISRIEQGRMKYEKSAFDVADLAKKAVTELTAVAAKKGLTLSIDAPEDLTITADIGKVKQIIVNLIDNAIKYTKAGSVSVKVEKQEKTVRITITDTGIGISAEELGGLFEKFKRARGANQVNTTGTGLGLYVAKQLTEGHGGKVWAESDGAGKGSRFIIELPL